MVVVGLLATAAFARQMGKVIDATMNSTENASISADEFGTYHQIEFSCSAMNAGAKYNVYLRTSEDGEYYALRDSDGNEIQLLMENGTLVYGINALARSILLEPDGWGGVGECTGVYSSKE
jgi:hypothetical protein